MSDSGTERHSIESVELATCIKFSVDYRKILETYVHAIIFEHGASFRMTKKSPVDHSDGYQLVDFLYGLSGDNNLVKVNRMMSDSLPENMVAFGGTIGGDQVCIGTTDARVYFWHHEAAIDDSDLYSVADNIDVFIANLKPDPGKMKLGGSGAKSTSYLKI